ncbi:MAG: hypothetical protein KAJ66_07080 [Candidatus Omnitrophica bacterium]|nr:hypothetical protein [Candidatus Omnitrophota bacterium]
MMLNEKTNNNRWKLYSFLLILLSVVLNLKRWGSFPSFIDIYYHLSVAEGFNKAGGYAVQSFWEFAPIGRLHVYPPFIHTVILLFYKLKLPLLLIARLIEFTIFPILLFTIWYVIKKVFYERLAFFSVLAAISTYAFYLSVSTLIPASLALIFGLAALLAIEKNKAVSASLLLCLSLYSQAGVSWFICLALFIYGFLNRTKFKICLISLVSALLLTLPLFVHQFRALEYVDLRGIRENLYLEINILIYLTAAAGIFFSLRKKGSYCFFIALLIAMVPFLGYYKYRYICGQGMIGLILLSALTLDTFYQKAAQKAAKNPAGKGALYTYFTATLFLFLIFSPTIYHFQRQTGFLGVNSTYANFLKAHKRMKLPATSCRVSSGIRHSQEPAYAKASTGSPPFIPMASHGVFWRRRIIRPNETSIHFPKSWKKASDIIRENFAEGDIIYSNQPYIAGVVSVYSGHATSTAMLSEIGPLEEFDALGNSKIIVWFKRPDNKPDEKLTLLIKKHGLEPVGETDILYIFKNPRSSAKETIKKAFLPAWFMFFILFAIIAVIIRDLKSNKNIIYQK